MNNLSWDDFKEVISDYIGTDASEITENTDILSLPFLIIKITN